MDFICESCKEEWTPEPFEWIPDLRVINHDEHDEVVGFGQSLSICFKCITDKLGLKLNNFKPFDNA